jgi:TPR repeat protein
MKKSLVTFFLTLTILLGSVGVSASADFQKGLTAYKSGDYVTALREFRPLAEQGDADAQGNLAAMYYGGTGVLKDYVYAHMWGSIALTNGNKGGGMLAVLIERWMTPAEISTAQKLARECISKKYKGC